MADKLFKLVLEEMNELHIFFLIWKHLKEVLEIRIYGLFLRENVHQCECGVFCYKLLRIRDQACLIYIGGYFAYLGDLFLMKIIYVYIKYM